MTTGRICTREVSVISPSETATAGAARMADHDVGTLVVVDEANRPLGIVTDRDLVVRVLARGLDAASTRIEAVMTPEPRTIGERTPIELALSVMRAGRLRRLPVVDDEGKLVGIQSLDDTLGLLAEELTIIGGLLERQSRVSEARSSAAETRTAPAGAGSRHAGEMHDGLRRALIRRLRRRREEIFERAVAAEAGIEELGSEAAAELVERGQGHAVSLLLARLDDRARGEVQTLDRALARLTETRDATCRSCQQPISFARLLAVPTTTLCVDCAQVEEGRRAS